MCNAIGSCKYNVMQLIGDNMSNVGACIKKKKLNNMQHERIEHIIEYEIGPRSAM